VSLHDVWAECPKLVAEPARRPTPLQDERRLLNAEAGERATQVVGERLCSPSSVGRHDVKDTHQPPLPASS
jgi:hypothetical protein